MTRALLGWVATMTVACSSGPPPSSTPPATTATSPPTSRITVTKAPPSEPDPKAHRPKAPEPPPSPEPPPGSDHTSAAPCHADADCGFDDPCVPTRCMASHAEPDRKCAESAPPPGDCICLAGRCTLEPHDEPKPDGPCEVRGCKVDRAGGRCVADTGGVAENFRSNGGVNLGPSCDCIEPAKGCRYTWYDPIPCRTERDCWVAEEPRPHPIRRPAHLRGRDFRPCSDGEIAPACGKQGHCILGLPFGC